MPEMIPEKKVRQGPRGKPVLYVLIGSLVLLGIYMVGLLTWSGTTSPPDHASQSQDAARKTATGSETGGSSSARDATSTPATNPANPTPSQPTAR